MGAVGMVLCAVLLLLLLLVLYKYGTRTHGSLEQLGIPVIKPYPFIGSVLRPWRIVAMGEDIKNARRFGRVWGQYDGPTPQVFVADVDMAKQILIKDFDYFTDRPQLFDFELGRDQLDMLPGEKWKTLRAVLAPSLRSAGKLKAMMPTMVQCCEDAGRRLDAHLACSPLVSVRNQLFGPLTLDIMSQYSFGMKAPNVADTNSKFVKYASAFGVPAQCPDSWLTAIMTSFPSLASYLTSLEIRPAMKFFMNVVRQTIKQRRQSDIRRNDLVDTIRDVVDNRVGTAQFQQLNITEPLVVLQGAEMLMAAYDTIGTALCNAAYFLATSPGVQERARKEATDAIAASGGQTTYDSLQQLPLLEAVMKESLRLAPLLHRHFRVCTRSWEWDGLRLPAGTHVMIPLTPLHRDAQVFPEPDQFRPDRWLGEQGHSLGQYHFMPFGLGPRQCIGSRLGMMECKYVLAHFLQRYRLSAAPETKMEFITGNWLFCATKPIVVHMEKIS